MIVQLYQATAQNPEAFLIDFEHNTLSDIFFELSDFLKDENIKAIKIEVDDFHNRVSITYLSNFEKFYLDAPNDAYIMSLNQGKLTYCLKHEIFKVHGLTDDPGEVQSA